MDTTQVEDLEVRLFLEALRSRHGYDLRGYAGASLRRRVLNTLSRMGLTHLGELQHQMLTDPSLLPEIIDGLTVQVSDMFRDPSFFVAFRERVVPHLKAYPRIKIWHAGCSSGEEVYSAAIVLLEEGLYERSQIYATDVSSMALARAKQGVYPATRLRTFAENYTRAGGRSALADYLSQAYERIALSEVLKKNVFFFQHDLVSDHVFGEMQVIFCRNVMLYFGGATRTQVFSQFVEALCHGGFLALGSAERLPSEHVGLVAFDEDERIYRHWDGSGKVG